MNRLGLIALIQGLSRHALKHQQRAQLLASIESLKARLLS